MDFVATTIKLKCSFLVLGKLLDNRYCPSVLDNPYWLDFNPLRFLCEVMYTLLRI